MSHYQHLSIEERENLLVMRERGYSLRQMAQELGRSPSTISREFKRNLSKFHNMVYRPSRAQSKYKSKRKLCGRKKSFLNRHLWETVRGLIVEKHWSPQQISERLKLENHPQQVSFATIYRAINKRVFDTNKVQKKHRGFKRNLRHKGKHRRVRSKTDNRGRMSIPHTIDERPLAANDRTEAGHWEADTVIGSLNTGVILTLVDRQSRLLLAKKLAASTPDAVAGGMIELLQTIPSEYVKSVTPDMGFEFRYHAKVSAAFPELSFYFAHPHCPWERGTNENTNGLLREYFPKRTSFSHISDILVQLVSHEINLRPRQCLAWKSPFEVFFRTLLHLL